MAVCRTVCVLITLVAALSRFGSGYAAKWDEEYWQYVDWTHWKCGRCKLYAEAEVRIDRQLSKFYFYKIAEHFAFEASENLDLEAHYAYEFQEPRGIGHFFNACRFELELNPHFDLCEHVKLRLRNRVEFFKRQGAWKIQTIFRQRTKMIHALPEGGRLKSINIWNEAFIDLNINHLTQNRFVPVELTLALGKERTLDIFVMVRNFTEARKWYQSVVMGSFVKF